MFDMTHSAAQQVKQAAREGGTEGMPLRLAAQLRGDGSIDYHMGFDEVHEQDIQLTCHGVDLVIGDEYLELLEEAVMDYVELEPGRFHFIFLNPRDANYTPPTDE